MGVVGLVAVLQMTISATDQGPLLAGLAVYAAILFIKVLSSVSASHLCPGLAVWWLGVLVDCDLRGARLCAVPADLLHHLPPLLGHALRHHLMALEAAVQEGLR